MDRKATNKTSGKRGTANKKKSENGCRLPDPIRAGEILTDITKNNLWKLGKSIGAGGFGEIYLASKIPCKSVGPDAQFVIKVEPHTNGPLFVERNFYVRVARPKMIEEWKENRRLKHLGMSPYLGSGSHVYKGEKYRFLVLKRYGEDLGKLFIQSGRCFPVKTAFCIGLQVLDALEYVHDHGYIHADIKGSNLLLGYNKGTENNVYLLDFGLAVKYRMPDGTHKEYRYDGRRAHDGTLEYTSRDAHTGAHSRRGDMEILGYNILQWLCGRLPWEDCLSDPEMVHEKKKAFMSNIPSLMQQCFRNSEPPGVLSQYLKYVESLAYETKPHYDYCRHLFWQGIQDAECVNEKLEIAFTRALNINKKCEGKRKATEPENVVQMKLRKIGEAGLQRCVAHNYNRMTRSSPASLQSLQFNWQEIISGNPEKDVKKVNCKVGPHGELDVGIPLKKLKLQSSPEQPQPSTSAGVDSCKNPTPAMLEIISKRRERSSLSSIGRKSKARRLVSSVGRKSCSLLSLGRKRPVSSLGRKSNVESCFTSRWDSSYPFTLTHAMQLVIQGRNSRGQSEEEKRQPMEEEKQEQLEDDEVSSASDLSHISDNLGDVCSSDSYSEDEERFKLVRKLRYSPPMRKKSENVQLNEIRTRGSVQREASGFAAVRRRRCTSVTQQKKRNPVHWDFPSIHGRTLRNNTLRG